MAAPLALLTACSSEDVQTSTASDHPNGAIELTAGIVEGGPQLQTRAGAEDHHSTPGHLNLTNGTKLALQVSGTWTGHGTGTVVQTTTATVGAVTGADNKHNALSCSPVLYWDDYGMADPANATTGRTAGLTIYGVAVNGKTTAPTVSDYTALDWTLYDDQTQTSQKPEDTDLLISNNVQSDTDDGTYLFANRASGKLLEFTHALSKITVNLKAGDGFTGSEFAEDPTATLINNWTYTTGTVDVTTGVVSSQGDATVITMNQKANATAGYNVTKEALVIPGSAFATDASEIVKINADGNIYYVTAKKIRDAIDLKFGTTTAADAAIETLAGYNYVINVIVNKTDIEVTATVTNWVDVNAAEVAPVINVSANFGESGSAMGDGTFSFYRSLALNNGYSANKTLVSEKYYPEESYVTKSSDTWTMSPLLYWPDHNTHYQFRGVWPRTESVGGPRVEDGTGATDGYQVIKVQNVAYTANSFPSDLQIARPEFADEDETCSNSETGHTTTNRWMGGICATEGKINLNFKYMMSQVEVNLSTTDNTLGDAVTLSGAVVDIVNVYSTGDVKLGDRGVVTTGSTGSYTLSTVAGAGNENKRWSAIVPQTLTYTTAQASTNVRFKITITNANSTTDVYYADIAPIKKSGSEDLVAPTGKWESGYHYIYNLKLSKTKVNVTATLANWTTVDASEDVWF